MAPKSQCWDGCGALCGPKHKYKIYIPTLKFGGWEQVAKRKNKKITIDQTRLTIRTPGIDSPRVRSPKNGNWGSGAGAKHNKYISTWFAKLYLSFAPQGLLYHIARLAQTIRISVFAETRKNMMNAPVLKLRTPRETFEHSAPPNRL